MKTITRNSIKRALFEAYGVKSVSALLKECKCAKNANAFNKITIEDVTTCLGEQLNSNNNISIDIPKLISKVSEIYEVHEKQEGKPLKCSGNKELFEGGFNKDFIMAYLIKPVGNEKDCWEVEIELTNGSKYFRYVNSQAKADWLRHFGSLPNWV